MYTSPLIQLFSIGWAIAVLANPGFTKAADQSDDKPNVILVVVDDLGWMDLSCQGSQFYKTPHIDGLAVQGIRFLNGYAASAVCSPTRAAIQTGRYPHRLGVTDWIRSRFQRASQEPITSNPTEYTSAPKQSLSCPPNPYFLDPSELTIADMLSSSGYRCGYVGKWHLGDEDFYPEKRGYHVNKGGCDYGQPPSYFDPFNNPMHPNPMIKAGIYNLPGKNPGEFLTKRESDEVVSLIEAWRDQPFFIQLSHYAVHTPIQAQAQVEAKYSNVPGKTKQNAKYAAMVESVDESMRSIRECLEKWKLTDNTIVIFTSDNGGLDNKGEPTDNAPLRSGKGYAYEGGIRVPLIVCWPGQIPANSVSSAPVSSIDFFPTILEACRTQAPKDRSIDGISLVSHLKSGGSQSLSRSDLVWHFPHYRHDPGPYSILRSGPWKLIKYWHGKQELFQLNDDPTESNDLAAAFPKRVQEMDKLLVDKLQSDGAKLPRPNPNYIP
ncbi:MAG: sulfatase [Pirellula sp.]|jgi:arylsulfatase A